MPVCVQAVRINADRNIAHLAMEVNGPRCGRSVNTDRAATAARAPQCATPGPARDTRSGDGSKYSVELMAVASNPRSHADQRCRPMQDGRRI
jgi:hypothetical protein